MGYWYNINLQFRFFFHRSYFRQLYSNFLFNVHIATTDCINYLIQSGPFFLFLNVYININLVLNLSKNTKFINCTQYFTAIFEITINFFLYPIETGLRYQIGWKFETLAFRAFGSIPVFEITKLHSAFVSSFFSFQTALLKQACTFVFNLACWGVNTAPVDSMILFLLS